MTSKTIASTAAVKAAFEAARANGVKSSRLAGKISKAGSAGHKAYLHVVKIFDGSHIACLSFSRPRAGRGYEAHSFAPTTLNPGAWVVTASGVSPVSI